MNRVTPEEFLQIGGRRTSGPGARALAARWTLAAVLVGSVLALGSLHTVVLLAVTAVLAVAAGLAWFRAEPMRTRPAANLVLAVGVGLVAWTAFQLVPWPAAWVARLSPHAADVWARALLPLHLSGPSWIPLSLDPTATRVELLRGVAYLLAFLAALRVAARPEGTIFLERTLLAAGVLVAAAALIHPALEADRLFGVYKPIYFHNPSGPLLNTNHLSGYLNIAFCIGLAAALAPEPWIPRPVVIALVTLLVATQLKVASRGGVGTMVLGAVLVVWMTRAGRRNLDPTRASWLPIGLLLAAGVGMGVLSASDTAWNDLANTDLSKLAIFKQAATMIPVYPIFGVGRGAFESTFPELRTGVGHWLFTHPEDIALQWAIEWGIPVAVAAAATLVWALRPSVALARSYPTVGAWAALATVSVHNLVDFSSEVPGVVIALAVCAAMIVGGGAGGRLRGGKGRWARFPNAVGALAVGVAAIALLLATSSIGKDLNHERAAIRAEALDPNVSEETFHADVEAAILRHPAEPYLPFAGAMRAMRAGDEGPVPWISRTLERAQVYGGAHLLLARSLFGVSPAQARFEYRLAVTQNANMAGYVAHEATPLIHDYYDAVELSPDGPAGPVVLEEVARNVALRLPATRVRIDGDILVRKPDALAPAARKAADALVDLRAGEAAPWCDEDRDRCVAQALRAAERIQALAPNKGQGYAFEANVRLEAGDRAKALTLLSEACERVEDRPKCLLHLAELAAKAGDEARVAMSLEQVGRAGCMEERECVENLLAVARFEERRGATRRALLFYKRASERAPEREDLLKTVGALASIVGVHGEALEAYKTLAQRHPDDAQYQQAVASEQRALMAEGLKR